MADQHTIRKEIDALVESQLLAVLSTHRDGQPYANLVAFVTSEDLATARSTRKFTNIRQDNRIAMLIDNRSNQSTDFHEAAAVTVVGSVVELEGKGKDEVEKKYIAKHPCLEEFLKAPTTALLRVAVSRYIMVTRFREVFELNMGA